MINNQNLAVLSEKVAHLESAVKNSDEASEISYDNTDSGLAADDVQGAIDELAPALTADGTEYSTGVSVKDKIDSMETNSVETVAFTNTKLSDSYNLRFERVGKIVELKTTLYASSDISPSEVIGTAPVGYRPTTDVFGSTKDININVGADGTIALKNTSATLQAGAWYVLTMCYII